MNHATPLTLYARREPTQETGFLAGTLKFDTVYYRDAQCTEFLARKPWHQSGHPRKNSKSAWLNCYRWLLWVSPGTKDSAITAPVTTPA